LLDSLKLLTVDFPNIKCLMPGSIYCGTERWIRSAAKRMLRKLGFAAPSQKFAKKIEQLGLENVCIRMPFRIPAAPLFAACDVLVFPSIRPHFARPILEAYAMAKCVVASDLPGVSEVVEDGRTGFLVPPGDPVRLADALKSCLQNRERRHVMGEFAHDKYLEEFSRSRSIAAIDAIYRSLIPRVAQTK
jgi:glycosyltransferase involved in cell wall biosynthesis